MARDEERCIARCISSVKDFVDEVVILDTGSGDDTAEIAASCGARIERFCWVDDFAVARNYGLAKIRTPWVITLDADEWLIAGESFIQEVKNFKASTVYEVCMHMRPYDSPPTTTPSVTGTFFTPRVFPSHLRYRGRIHETLVHQLPVARAELLLGHDGYEPAQRERKSDRNTKLIQYSLDQEPENPFLHYYFAKDLRLVLETNSAELSTQDLNRIAEHFRLATNKLPVNSSAWELFAREYLLFLRDYSRFADGINLIFTALQRNALSLELSYTAAIFLYEAAIKQQSIPAELLIDNGDAFFVRVKTSIDRQSQYYPYAIDIGMLSNLRVTAYAVQAKRASAGAPPVRS